MFGSEIPCGCESRKEIMGSGDWQMDIAWAAGALAFVLLLGYLKK